MKTEAVKRWMTVALCTFTCITAFAATETLEFTNGDDFATINSGGNESLALTNSSGGDLVWDIGETLTIELDMLVADPDYISNAMGWGFGIGDDAQAVAFGSRYISASKLYMNASVDPSAGGAGSFSVDTGSTSDRDELLVVDGTNADLRDTGETAHLICTASRNATNDYSMKIVWMDSTKTVYDILTVVTTNAAVDTFQEFLFRVNTPGTNTTDSYTLTNIVMTVDSTMTEYVEFDSSAEDTWTSSGTQTRWMRPIDQGGSNRVWNAGEKVTIEFDVQVLASTDPVDYSLSSMTLGFGLGDDAEAICWGIKHQNFNFQFGNISIDTSATGAGTVSANLFSSGDRERLTGIEGTAYDLYDSNETAHVILTAEYTGGTEYITTFTMADSPALNTFFTITRTNNESVVIDTIDEFHVRRNLTSGTADYSFTNFTVKLESSTEVVPSADPYDTWATANGVSGGKTGDDDSDGLNNFGEYVFEGIPTGTAGVTNQGVLPTFAAAEGDYIFSLRADTNLSYYVLTRQDLTVGSWGTNAGPIAITEADGAMDGYTNTVGTTADELFMKLEVESN